MEHHLTIPDAESYDATTGAIIRQGGTLISSPGGAADTAAWIEVMAAVDGAMSVTVVDRGHYVTVEVLPDALSAYNARCAAVMTGHGGASAWSLPLGRETMTWMPEELLMEHVARAIDEAAPAKGATTPFRTPRSLAAAAVAHVGGGALEMHKKKETP